jgi:hypothetical protein
MNGLDGLAGDTSGLESVREYAPSLLPIAEQLLASSGGNAAITTAGPQAEAGLDDLDPPDAPPYFYVGSYVDHPGFRDSTDLGIKVTAQQVELWITFAAHDGKRYCELYGSLTHEQLAAYFRQLPKRITSFQKETQA